MPSKCRGGERSGAIGVPAPPPPVAGGEAGRPRLINAIREGGRTVGAGAITEIVQ
jgi:hypothetical protein